MSTRFILVRHGQTEWNRIERFRGRADIPLNDTGREQAHQIAQRLAREHFAAVYTGPLQRALATAKPIAEANNLPVQILPGLIDIDYGSWQKLTPEEATAKYPKEYALWLNRPAEVHFPSGESLNEVRVRAMTTICNLAKIHESQTIVLVGHKILNKVILCAVLGLSSNAIGKIEQDNGAINRFEFRNWTWIIQSLNDTCHLS